MLLVLANDDYLILAQDGWDLLTARLEVGEVKTGPFRYAKTRSAWSKSREKKKQYC